MEQETREKIQWQSNVNLNERTCILRPDHLQKSTQQSLCINFVRRLRVQRWAFYWILWNATVPYRFAVISLNEYSIYYRHYYY